MSQALFLTLGVLNNPWDYCTSNVQAALRSATLTEGHSLSASMHGFGLLDAQTLLGKCTTAFAALSL